MRSLVLSLVVFLACVGETFAVGWQAGNSPDGTQCTSASATVGGVWYRIRQDGGILRRTSGDSTFRLVRLSDIPEPARAEVASQYDRFVPVTEQKYSQSTLQQYRATTDRSDRSDRSNRSQSTRTTTDSRRTDRHDRHDASDRSVREDHSDRSNRSRQSDSHDQYDVYRDRDIRYRAHTDGAQSPSVIMANNYLENSRMSVDVHPVSETASMAAFAENRLLLAELIAARRERDHQQQTQSVTQIVNVNCGGCSRPPCQQQQLTTLCTRCWQCGTHFTDQFGRRWHRISGPAVKPHPSQLQGTLGKDAQGRITFTTQFSGQSVVFVGL